MITDKRLLLTRYDGITIVEKTNPSHHTLLTHFSPHTIEFLTRIAAHSHPSLILNSYTQILTTKYAPIDIQTFNKYTQTKQTNFSFSFNNNIINNIFINISHLLTLHTSLFPFLLINEREISDEKPFICDLLSLKTSNTQMASLTFKDFSHLIERIHTILHGFCILLSHTGSSYIIPHTGGSSHTESSHTGSFYTIPHTLFSHSLSSHTLSSHTLSSLTHYHLTHIIISHTLSSHTHYHLTHIIITNRNIKRNENNISNIYCD
jgi:hypothetical protein